MKDENEWMKNTLFQDLTSEHEKNFKIVRFYMATLKSKVQFSHLKLFFFFVALFWLNILTGGHTKSQPDT